MTKLRINIWRKYGTTTWKNLSKGSITSSKWLLATSCFLRKLIVQEVINKIIWSNAIQKYNKNHSNIMNQLKNQKMPINKLRILMWVTEQFQILT
jgi:hypothetical protein